MSGPLPRSRRLAVGLLGVAVLAVGCSYTSREALPPARISAQSSTIYAADGTLIYTFHAEENRRDVSLGEVPTTLRDAVVAIEDERFYRHNGVDLRGLLRAVRANAEAGGVAQGGSTITQQYVKQALLHDSSRTVERKLQEASLALQLERHYSKDKILELYLNAVYFGNNAYGVEAAAHQYFTKSVKDLDLAESALLAGLIQRPAANDPYDNPEGATTRRNLVLDRMEKNHLAAAADVAAAKASALTLGSATTPAAERYQAAYFVEQVKQWILDDPRFGAIKQERLDLLFSGGLKIRTTVDLKAQAAAEAAANAVLPDADRDPDVALVSIVPDTGEVRAMVGGRDFFGAGSAAKLNLAVQGRQAGSSFKPLVLAAALAEGVPPTQTYSAPGCLQVPWYNDGKSVCNYSDSESVAAANLVEGTVHSYNTLYVQLMHDVGATESMEVAKDLGIRSPLEPVASAVLGTNDVSAVDMASAYGTFANRGIHVDPVLVTRITRDDGTVLYRHDHEENRVIEPDVADTVTAILEQVIQRGTATAARLDRPAAGKTGTAQDWHDAWFIGYTPELVTSVWVGFHEAQISMQPPTTPIKVVGGSYPARIWQKFMSATLAGTPVSQFHAPPPNTFVATTDTSILDDAELQRQIDEFYEQQSTGGGTGGNDDPTRPPPTSTTLSNPGTTPSGGGRTAVVPDVTGKQAETGAALLHQAGFSVVKRSTLSQAKSGTIISQSPPGGTTAREGSTVIISVAS